MYKISVFVLDLNRSEDTIECVNRVLEFNDNSVRVNILINGSNYINRKNITDHFESCNRVNLYHSNTNLGFTGGVNYLLQRVVDHEKLPDYILLLNNDAFVYRDTLEVLKGFMDSDPSIGIASPTVVSASDNRTIVEDGIRIYPWLMQHHPLGSGKDINQARSRASSEMLVANGTCMLVRTGIFTKLGGLDEIFFAYFEDWDLCLRARKTGHLTVHVPEAVVSHKGSATTGKQSVLYQFLLTRNRYLIARKHLPVQIFAAIFLPYFLVSRVLIKLIMLISARNINGIKGLGMALCWIIAPDNHRSKFWPNINL